MGFGIPSASAKWLFCRDFVLRAYAARTDSSGAEGRR
jgi:hypothetical protein